MRLIVDEILYRAARRNLEKKGEDFDRAFENSLKRAGNIIAQEARSRAPSDSGEGKRTIRARKETRKKSKYYKSIVIGPNEDHKYMLFPEFGTENQDRQWFTHGALDEKENEILNSIERDLRAVLS